MSPPSSLSRGGAQGAPESHASDDVLDELASALNVAFFLGCFPISAGVWLWKGIASGLIIGGTISIVIVSIYMVAYLRLRAR